MHTLTAVAIVVLLLLLELGFVFALFAPAHFARLMRVWRFPLATLVILSLYTLGTAMANRTNARARTRLGPTARGARTAQPIPQTYVATSRLATLPIYDRPDGNVERSLASPNQFGFPLTLLVKQDARGWLDVYLPTRPNGSTGWVELAAVRLHRDPYAVVVNLTAKRMTVLNGSRTFIEAPVGVGRALTPTPNGVYFITDILKQPNPYGIYGPDAIGLSAHSTVLNEFDGGDGQVGLHGTNYPQGIGTNVSHGCVRMANVNIVRLADTLPLGTPVILTRGSL